MTTKSLINSKAIALIAISVLGAAALSACSPDPYPTPAAEAPPPPPPAELAGGYPPPPPPMANAPVIIAMAPIPNPPERPRRARRAARPAYTGSYVAPRYVAPAHTPAKPVVVARAAPAKVTPPAKVALAAKKTLPALKSAAAPKVAVPAPAPATGDRAARLSALQDALSAAISKGAKLIIPDRFTAGEPADVRLTVPADFADTLKAEADKNTLADAAKSANLTALLSGEGYGVTPDETQSLPVTAGQPTEFHWSVTAQPNAKGPLHADVGADLLGGGGDTLNLGSVTAGQGWFGLKDNRLLGFGIIVLLFTFVIAFLARGRSTPSRSASARRAARRAVNHSGSRPFDIGDGEAV